MCVCINGLSLQPCISFKQGMPYVCNLCSWAGLEDLLGFPRAQGEGKMIYLIMDEAKYLHTLQFTYCSPGGLAMTKEACSPWGVD